MALLEGLKNNLQSILLRGQDDYERTKERWEVLKEFFRSKFRLQRDYKSGGKHTKIICDIPSGLCKYLLGSKIGNILYFRRRD